MVTPVIPAPRRLRQEDFEFQGSLIYLTKCHLKKKKKGKKERRKRKEKKSQAPVGHAYNPS
jgi:hypothetical protein